jgi:hypothetical protein
VTKAGQDENLSRAKHEREDRGEDKDRDENWGEDIGFPSIYSNKMNK